MSSASSSCSCYCCSSAHTTKHQSIRLFTFPYTFSFDFFSKSLFHSQFSHSTSSKIPSPISINQTHQRSRITAIGQRQSIRSGRTWRVQTRQSLQWNPSDHHSPLLPVSESPDRLLVLDRPSVLPVPAFPFAQVHLWIQEVPATCSHHNSIVFIKIYMKRKNWKLEVIEKR